jgi:hypothetical protein
VASDEKKNEEKKILTPLIPIDQNPHLRFYYPALGARLYFQLAMAASNLRSISSTPEVRTSLT